MRLSEEEQDLVRWCYLVGGLSRAQLARDFECSISDIEGIVSTGLGRVLNPASAAKDKRKPRKLDFQATSPQPQTRTQKTEREQLLDSFRRCPSPKLGQY